MVHYGHSNQLRQARAMGDYLIVGVHTDGKRSLGFAPLDVTGRPLLPLHGGAHPAALRERQLPARHRAVPFCALLSCGRRFWSCDPFCRRR